MSSQSAFGLISGFDHHNQDWKTYRSRLNQWFIANDITAEFDKSGVKRKAILLSALNESTYQLASNLALPQSLDRKTFEEVIKLLDDHFTPRRCVFAERSYFYGAVQRVGEDHAQWAARLRGLAAHCGFKNLEDALLDRFVMGMSPGPEREKLFAQDATELTLSKAVELAVSSRCSRDAANASSAGAAAPTGSEPVFVIDDARRQFRDNKCAVCGFKNHKTSECRFSKYKCKKCNKTGHLRRMCKSIKFIERAETSEDDDDDGKVYNIRSIGGAPMLEKVNISGLDLRFEIDSGSAVTAISKHLYEKHFKDVLLSPCRKKLISYSGTSIECLGIAKLPFTYRNQTETLNVYVIPNGGPSILGRDFICIFGLQLQPIKYCNFSESSTEALIDKIVRDFPELFSGKLGCFKNFKVKLPLKVDAKPIFFKARPIAFALKEKVNKEIDQLVRLGILEQIQYSDYASPIVPVLKRDGSVRICADYSQTINKQLLVEKYPLPSIEDLFSKLHGGEQFTKLDMSMAYNQLQIEDNENITCINTTRGLFKYNRLVFGLSSAPAIFQRVLVSILGDIEGVLIFLDDVLITAKSRSLHLEKLYVVLKRLRDAGLTLHKDKCSFFQDEINYLGYEINKYGIKKSPGKVNAILKAPVPQNLNQLQSFLGLVNYYRNFVRGASSILSPLYDLLKKEVKWSWTLTHENAFNEIKNCLASDQVLAHFNPAAQIVLTVDASPFGLGAVLSQIDSDGIERPISFASRTLNAAEKKYAQIQKEATAIIFGVKRFHQYLYARSVPFILRTDHKPLISIFGSQRGIPEITANRLQRYAIFLSAYNYTIEYVRSSNNSADYLSRATMETGPTRGCRQPTRARTHTNEPPTGRSGRSADDAQSTGETMPTLVDNATYINFVVSGSLPVTLSELRQETKKDIILQKVIKFVNEGWPRKVSDIDIKPYYNCRLQLAYENGCLMRGHKVIIPSRLINKVLTELHSSHLGIVKCKAEARSRFWFPGIDANIEKMVLECEVCSKLRSSPPRAPLESWNQPLYSFQRIHLDFLGPINNQMYLVVVDAYSKWVECYDMKNNITTIKLIEKISEVMSRFGIPETIVTDNGTSFVSAEFKHFCDLNGIHHLTSPVYHPSSNGQAESYVKIIKKGIKSVLLSTNGKNLTINLNKYIFDYRNSKHSNTGVSPAELVFGHPLKSRLDLIVPKGTLPSSSPVLVSNGKIKQFLQNKYSNGKSRKQFSIGDNILYKSYVNKNKFNWCKGIIRKRLGKVLFLIEDLETRVIVKRHLNQVIASGVPHTGTNNQPVIESDSTSTVQPSLFQPAVGPRSPSLASGREGTEGPSMSTYQPHSSSAPDPATTGTESVMVNASPRMQLRTLPRIDYKKFF